MSRCSPWRPRDAEIRKLPRKRQKSAWGDEVGPQATADTPRQRQFPARSDPGCEATWVWAAFSRTDKVELEAELTQMMVHVQVRPAEPFGL